MAQRMSVDKGVTISIKAECSDTLSTSSFFLFYIYVYIFFFRENILTVNRPLNEALAAFDSAVRGFVDGTISRSSTSSFC